MTLKDFDSNIARKLGVPKATVRAVIRELEVDLKKNLVFGVEVVIHNIGKFKQTKREERKQHNVQTGKMATIPKHYKIQFKTTPAFDSRIKAKKVY